MSATRSNMSAAECLTRRRVENCGISVVRWRSCGLLLTLPRWGRVRRGDAVRPGSTQPCKILARMMGGARQRRRRHHQETLRIGDGLVGLEFVGRHKTRYRMMFPAGLQILSDGKEIDLR